MIQQLQINGLVGFETALAGGMSAMSMVMNSRDVTRDVEVKPVDDGPLRRQIA